MIRGILLGLAIGLVVGVTGTLYFDDISAIALDKASTAAVDAREAIHEQDFTSCKARWLDEASCADRKLIGETCTNKVRQDCDRNYQGGKTLPSGK